MLSAIKRQMISDGAIRIGELHFAGPVPDEGDYPTELEGKWWVDGTWIDPKWLSEGRKQEMEYMRKIGLLEVVDEKECFDNGCKPANHSKLKWVDKMKGEMCRSRLVCREIKRARDRDDQLGLEDVFSPMPPSEGLEMLVSTMMQGRGNSCRRSVRDGNVGCVESALLRWSSQVDLHISAWRSWTGGQVGQTLQKYVWNARRRVYLERHMVRSVEREFHEGRSRVSCFLL